MTVRLSKRAESDLEGIYRYIAAHSASNALRMVTAILDALRVLEQFPEAGRPRDELMSGVRAWPVLQYTAYYIVDEGEVLVARILGGGQNVAPERFS